MGRAFEYRRAAKEKRWDKMSKLFPKLAKAITVAAKEGGGDLETNAKLRTAVQNARAENMPKDNIERAIQRAIGKDAVDYTELVYEGKGLHGTLFMVEVATDNTNRSVANVKSYFSKAGGQVVNMGSLEFMFNRKAVFEFELTEGMDLEELELELIDAGLEELEVQDAAEEDDPKTVFAFGDYKSFGTLSKGLEDLGIEVKKGNLQRIPTSPITLTEEQMEEVEKLIDRLEDDDDVQAVFSNIA